SSSAGGLWRSRRTRTWRRGWRPIPARPSCSVCNRRGGCPPPCCETSASPTTNRRARCLRTGSRSSSSGLPAVDFPGTGARQDDFEDAALQARVFPEAQRLTEGGDQADAEARVLAAGARRVLAPEAVEEPRQVLRSKVRGGVGDAESEISSGDRRRAGHRAAGSAIG